MFSVWDVMGTPAHHDWRKVNSVLPAKEPQAFDGPGGGTPATAEAIGGARGPHLEAAADPGPAPGASAP